MADTYKGELQVGVLNSKLVTGFAKNDVYRVISDGNLKPNNFPAKFGDFVKWDGSKWIASSIRYALDTEVKSVKASLDNAINSPGTPGGGNYYTDETLHEGQFIMVNDSMPICVITGGPFTDGEGEQYYTYVGTKGIFECLNRLEDRIYAIESAGE